MGHIFNSAWELWEALKFSYECFPLGGGKVVAVEGKAENRWSSQTMCSSKGVHWHN